MTRHLRVVMRPAVLAPPLRLSRDLSGDRVVLHTVQSGRAFEQLLASGILRSDPTLVPDDWRAAYQWLSTRMVAQLGDAGVGEGMLWFWARTHRRDLASLLRSAKNGDVLITASVAREQVLFSDFDAWHDVLNRWLHVPNREGESMDAWSARAEPIIDEWSSRVELYSRMPHDLWPAALRSELESSWMPIASPMVVDKVAHVQATTRDLRLKDVVRVVRVR